MVHDPSRAGQLISLEMTIYQGATKEAIVQGVLGKGLRVCHRFDSACLLHTHDGDDESAVNYSFRGHHSFVS